MSEIPGIKQGDGTGAFATEVYRNFIAKIGFS